MEKNQMSDSERLLMQLFKENDLDRFLHNDDSMFLMPSFGKYLEAWCKGHNVVAEHLIIDANLERSYGHQLFKDKRNPSRDTVLQLAFAMKADVEQAQEMLQIARKAGLYPKVKRDAVIIFCLHHHISLVNTGIILADLELPELGGLDR